MRNFGIILLALSGAFAADSKKELELRAAVAREESRSPKIPGRLDEAIVALGGALFEQGRYEEAQTLYERSRAINKEAFGPASLAAAQSLLRLGLVCHARLQWEMAESLSRQAVNLIEAAAGEDGVDYALASANLGAVLADEGQFARAEPILRRALFILERNHDPARVTIERNLGLVYLREGEPRRAEEMLERVAARAPGDSGSFAALAELYVTGRRWQDAAEVLRSAYRITVAEGREDQPEMAGILRLRAEVESAVGDARQAASDLAEALRILERVGGECNPALVPVFKARRDVLLRLKRKQEAKAEAERLRSVCGAARWNARTN